MLTIAYLQPILFSISATNLTGTIAPSEFERERWAQSVLLSSVSPGSANHKGVNPDSFGLHRSRRRISALQ
jgi:hypothetical protein